jgi:allantoate deiminase/N-carbamoyl-L-amino-acid hydrolase
MKSSRISGVQLMRRIEALAAFTEVPGQVTRTYLTPALKAAGEQLISWMQAAGMTAKFDALGNVIGRYEGINNQAPALMIGSHYDTVRNAGSFDGPYGVIAALAVVEALHVQKKRLASPIEVVAFGDEEGVRFKSTLIGSRAIAGTLEGKVLDVRDGNGVSMREALKAFGGNPSNIASAAKKKGSLRGYIELHIEQGPVLIKEKLPVGVVTSIAGASRFMVTITGTAGHAGTVPMGLRQDAAAAAAEFILAVEARCCAVPTLVGTVGIVQTPTGAANVIPGLVELSLDVRAATDVVRRAAVSDLKATLKAICARRGVKAAIRPTHEAKAVACDRGLRAALAASVSASGHRVLELASGAGHDAMAIADICPVAMLFVRCGNGGISHDPHETMTAADAAVGANVLLDAVELLSQT